MTDDDGFAAGWDAAAECGLASHPAAGSPSWPGSFASCWWPSPSYMWSGCGTRPGNW